MVHARHQGYSFQLHHPRAHQATTSHRMLNAAILPADHHIGKVHLAADSSSFQPFEVLSFLVKTIILCINKLC